MESKVKIIGYQPEHKAEIMNLFLLNTPLYFDASEEADLNNYLDNEIENYFVILLDNKLVGAGGINYNDQKTIAKISWDLIHPDFHGKKLGTLLLQHRLNQIKSMESIQKIVVRTSQFVHNFYAKNGFQLQYTTPNYWAEGFDLYYMEYALQT